MVINGGYSSAGDGFKYQGIDNMQTVSKYDLDRLNVDFAKYNRKKWQEVTR